MYREWSLQNSHRLSLTTLTLGLLVLALMLTASPASARPEEYREIRDEFDEEFGEIGEEDAEAAVISFGGAGDVAVWASFNHQILDHLIEGQDPLADPILVDGIRAAAPPDNPLHFVDIQSRVEEYAHAKGATRVAQVLRGTGPVFQEIAVPGSTDPLRCSAWGLVGLLLTLFVARVTRA